MSEGLTIKPDWMTRVDAKIVATTQKLHKYLDEFTDSVGAWGIRQEERKIRRDARLHLQRLENASIIPKTLVSAVDTSTAYSQLAKEYVKVRDAFMGTLADNVEQTLKHANPEEKAEMARWICATYIDEFETEAHHGEQLKTAQLLLTSRYIFNKGVGYSNQFDDKKIDTVWANEVGGILLSPKTPLFLVKEKLQQFVSNPPRVAK